LIKALGGSAPRYLHVPLVVGADGRRLAKRHGDTRVAAFRERGVSPQAILGELAHSCGWALAGEETTLAGLVPRFNLDTIPRAPFCFGTLP
jgi:glutamyl-tRNA synthetase